MPISTDQVKHIAKLARIRLTKEQQTRFAKQLSGIFEHIETLRSVNTDNVEATSQVTGLANVSRRDEIQAADNRTEILDQMPDRADDYLKVKAIL